MSVLFYYILLSYLLGSLSPGYFFGRTVKGIDIRDFKTKNTGASNTYQLVVPVCGIITGIFDGLKAAAAYWIALRGMSPDTAILVGLAAVLGHIWPFYLKFRGGRGVASLAGLAVIALYYTQSWYALMFITGGIVYGMILNKVEFEAPIRKFLKLGGLIFPLEIFWSGKEAVADIALTLLLIFLSFDILRFLVPRLNIKYLKLDSLAKQKEIKFFSGFTLFMTGVFVVINYFPSDIAIFTITAFIVSDIIAPAGKGAFLPIRFVKGKTIGGAMVVFATVMLAGIFLNSLTPLSLPLKIALSGAAIMALLDQLSFLIDDNILVPIGTAFILTFML